MLLDIKSAFLQNKNIDRAVYVKPPNEADCQANTRLQTVSQNMEHL